MISAAPAQTRPIAMRMALRRVTKRRRGRTEGVGPEFFRSFSPWLSRWLSTGMDADRQGISSNPNFAGESRKAEVRGQRSEVRKLKTWMLRLTLFAPSQPLI